ncbi:R-spondin-4 [Astyanax mexicanus]|uniref:R-spondin-4 n=1 Tax=Astyanax mexicanus TaxID=7994 RepID=UPI0020CABC55|nr:R-spondin-4 [Astyanax mexicanus]
MHLWFFVLLSLLCNTVMFSLAARKRRVSREVWLQGCRSCSECSRENGCLRCSDRLFLFLHRDGMSHHGSCLHSCPAGHYGLRGTDANRCIKCRAPECERCFDKDFCTKCKRGFLLYKGKCLSSCPEGSFPHSTDCVEDCVFSTAGNWAEWSPCLYNGLSCGVRWGRQNRTRVLSWRTPEELSELCPPQSESRKCRLKKRCRKDKQKKERRAERRRNQKQWRIQENRTITAPPGGT